MLKLPATHIKPSGLRLNLFWLLLPVVLFFTVLPAAEVKAQGRPQVVQLSGLVTAGDSLYGVAGASVFVPRAGRGANTNEYGYFSLPVLAGDSIVFRALGYEEQYVVIPKNYSRQNYSVILQLSEDVTVLPEVRIFPYSTEKLFKEAFLALKLESKEQSNADKNLNDQFLQQILANTGMDGAGNHRFYMNQQVDNFHRTGKVVTNPLLNPFAWLQVIESIKRGDFKKQK